jgi:septum formation topological specificity factor MinE
VIDEKIRHALHSKEEIIDRLRNELILAKERNEQIEELLENLNQNLTVR